jgi:organic radical activating enzyme
MTSLRETIQRLFSPSTVKPLPPGMYHYQAPGSDPRNYRLHLRLEPDGRGVLIVNAATVLHLNHTAAEYAFYLVQNLPEDQVVKNVSSRYHVNPEDARKHYRDFVERIDTLVTTTDLDPVTFLDFERQEPFSGHISAPYRLDCAITYQQRDTTDTTSSPNERVTRELSTAEWETALDKAWTAGIPHVVFTGGEPTLREDLPQLIAKAEANSQVTGLLSDGLWLEDQEYLETLLQTGLDHLMIIFQPENERAWSALKNALDVDLFVAVHLTLTTENQEQYPAYLQRLADAGVQAISISANAPELSERLHEARTRAAQLNMELVWNLPVPYSALNPVSLEIEEHEVPEGAGRAWLYVEPDGDVLPAQGVNQVLGNLLRDPWEQIWQPK